MSPLIDLGAKLAALRAAEEDSRFVPLAEREPRPPIGAWVWNNRDREWWRVPINYVIEAWEDELRLQPRRYTHYCLDLDEPSDNPID